MDDNCAEFLVQAGKTCIIWDNDKCTYEEVKMKNPLSFTPMMTAECRTGGPDFITFLRHYMAQNENQ
ncbi:MAG: hypothetical protein SOW60_06050 [Bacteroidaceae bacterium]|nr:hypothetical protein [Bacteroidaceae bacterium]